MTVLLAAFTIGILGSFHCVGMCGPIALALPLGDARGIKRLVLVLLYNAGRMLTYAIFGFVAGLAGKTIVLAGYQQLLSVLAGIAMLMLVLIPAGMKPFQKMNSGIFGFFNSIKVSLGRLFKKQGRGPVFSIGLLNGLLPCGLVYVALAGAVATGSLAMGAAFMAAFGMGTLPMMMALPYAGQFIGIRARNTMRRAVPAVLTVMAVLLILRGLNLGIPYLSPRIENEEKISCCHHQQAQTTNNETTCSGQSSQPNK